MLASNATGGLPGAEQPTAQVGAPTRFARGAPAANFLTWHNLYPVRCKSCAHASKLTDMNTAHDLGDGSFVAFLKAAMAAAEIPTGARLAELAGLNGSMVNRWLNGKATPTIDALREVAPHLRIPLPVLVVRAGHMTAEEMGLSDADLLLLTGNHSLEDEIRRDPRIRDDRKEPLIQFIETLFEEDPDSRTNVRDDSSA